MADGEVLALGVPAEIKRSRRVEGGPVPTMEEAGVKDFFFNSWFALVAPAGTPSAIIERLNAEMQKALLDPTVRARFDSYGLTIRGSSAKELGEQTKKQFEMYRQLIKANHISDE